MSGGKVIFPCFNENVRETYKMNGGKKNEQK